MPAALDSAAGRRSRRRLHLSGRGRPVRANRRALKLSEEATELDEPRHAPLLGGHCPWDSQGQMADPQDGDGTKAWRKGEIALRFAQFRRRYAHTQGRHGPLQPWNEPAAMMQRAAEAQLVAAHCLTLRLGEGCRKERARRFLPLCPAGLRELIAAILRRISHVYVFDTPIHLSVRAAPLPGGRVRVQLP